MRCGQRLFSGFAPDAAALPGRSLPRVFRFGVRTVRNP